MSFDEVMYRIGLVYWAVLIGLATWALWPQMVEGAESWWNSWGRICQ